MVLADFYKDQLKRLGASEIELTSNEAIKYQLPDGPRSANKSVQHQQVMQLVEEVASYAQTDISNISQTRQAVLGYSNVQLDVQVLDDSTWQVKITPRVDDSPPQYGRGAGRGSPSPAEAAPPATQPATPPAAQPLTQPQAAAAPVAAPAAAPQAETLESVLPPEVQEAISAAPVTETPPATPTATTPAAAPVSTSDEPRLNSYLRRMIAGGASDLHMSSGAIPMVRDSGEMTAMAGETKLTNEELASILMEVLPDKNAEEFAETWDTDFAHAIPGLARFRANYFMDQNGVGAVFRQIPYEILTPEQLGIPKEVLELCWLSKGLVLVTGPTGSGKSTTLAALIDYINVNRADHIITIEDPVEFVHPNKKCLVNQREIGTHTKSFKSALRAALREDPDIVLVGEMRDLETIAIAVETAETGHLVFGTLHTTTAPSTVDRIIDQFPSDQQAQIRTMLGGSLKGVISQVLCKKIGGGRAAAYEIMIGTSAIANNIREGKTHQLQSLMQTGKKEGMCTMNDSLLALAKNGKVDPREAYVKSVDKQGLKQMFAASGIKLELEGDA